MERLNRFDIAAFGDVHMVVVESALLPPVPSIVVIPLLTDYPPVRHLNPVIAFDGTELVLATRLIAAVRRSRLRYVGEVSEQGDLVTRAIDVLMGGI